MGRPVLQSRSAAGPGQTVSLRSYASIVSPSSVGFASEGANTPLRSRSHWRFGKPPQLWELPKVPITFAKTSQDKEGRTKLSSRREKNVGIGGCHVGANQGSSTVIAA